MYCRSIARPCANRSMAAVLAALWCALGGCGGSTTAAPPTGSTYTLMQMNLCLSGLAGCYGKVAYPAGVDEALTKIEDVRPDAVTLNEVCRRDVERIARRAGYHVRFSRVVYGGKLLRCVQPGGRGLFGNAILTAAAIERTDNEDFEVQAGPERRRWLCVTTQDVDVCTAHLNTRSPSEVAGNDGQCAELADILTRRAATGAVAFGGDVNRRRSCAPDHFWTRTDSAAGQAPGIQHVYGSAELRSPKAEVLPATHSDHDVLMVRAEKR